MRVSRGGNEVLRGLSFGLRRGRLMGLLGPSGCGKTTLMRALVGVQRRVSGELLVLGEAAGSPALRRRVAYVTQAPSVYGDLSVRENLAYFAAIAGAEPSRIATVLDSVDLTELGGRVVHGLSGGQRARVSLASALLGDPELLVLDEPTVGAGSAPATTAVVVVRTAGRSRHDAAGVEPRDGRGTPTVMSCC